MNVVCYVSYRDNFETVVKMEGAIFTVVFDTIKCNDIRKNVFNYFMVLKE